MMDKSRLVAEDIIALLDNKKGFDSWWWDIRPDIREEIVAEIAETLKEKYGT